MKSTPIFPLARLGPLGFLTLIAIVTALIVQIGDRFAIAWAGMGLLPLVSYLGYVYLRARKLILAEQGRERDIVRMGLVVMAAERAARFWSLLFSVVVIATGVFTAAIWGYQGFLSYVGNRWVPLTWQSVVGFMPNTEHAVLQRLFFWLSDTNFGVVVLIGGLLLAAPLAAINWRSNNKAKFRRNDLGNLKKRS